MTMAGGAPLALAGSAVNFGAPAELGSKEFARIAAIMQSDARIHLSEAKTTLVQSRLARRLRDHGVASYRDYVALVERDEQERAAMVVALTTNHTHFFREPHHFDHFRSVVIPRLKARQGPTRIWSAGCSSGEEVYTIAMCLLGEDRASASWLRNRDLKLLATDIAPHVVEAVQQASYAEDGANAVPVAYRDAWMRPTGDGKLQMAPEARELVTARILNLFGAWPMRQRYDVIFCRNVMIYFDDAAKAELEARFVEQLAPGGFLYIGHSERLIGPSARAMHSCGHTIYQKLETAA